MSEHEEEAVLETEETKKTKATEGSAIIQSQTEAVEKLCQVQTRKYTRAKVPLSTVGGTELWVQMWMSSTPPLNQSQAQSSAQDGQSVCEVCGREFLDRRRLAIHKNVHLKNQKIS